MSRGALLFCILLVFVSLCHAHPTLYPKEKKEYLKANGEHMVQSPPPFRSYHVHFMFQFHNNESCTGVNNALALRNKFMKDLNIDNLPCEGDFDQGRLCMFPIAFQPFGPFVAPEWAAFVPLEDYARVPWVMQNRGNFDAFVHPNSGFEREDHHDWSFWAGTPWTLDLSDPEFSEQLNKNVTNCDCP